MLPGLFITVEGIDGCGKSTQLALLARTLREQGREVVETVEPGGTLAGREIRSILLDPRYDGLHARTELLLYFASRAQNCAEVIAPSLEAGAIVLCDRFTDSTIVYQGAGRGIDERTIRELHSIACGPLYPDLTLLIDVDLATSRARASARNQAAANSETRLDEESDSFFARVRDGYHRLACAEPARIYVIDGRGSVEQVANEVRSAVERVMAAMQKS